MGMFKETLWMALGKDPAVLAQRGQDSPGCGYVANWAHLDPWRGTTVQVCGLYPFIAGSNVPLVGAPLGVELLGGGAVCADPISWFEQGLVSAPSAMVLGLNGYGKSSLIRRMLICQAAFGIHTMVLGDIKPDYKDVVEALGGQVITIGHAAHGVNPLDAGNVREAAKVLPVGRDRSQLLTAAHERKKTLICSLIQIIRRSPPTDREESILDEAIHVLEATEEISGEQQTIKDLLQVLRLAPDPIRLAALDRGDLDRYRLLVEPLEASLEALTRGRFGSLFSRPTTEPMMIDRSVVFDISQLSGADDDLVAAVLLACWSYGFASVEVAQTLAAHDLAPTNRFQIVMDELWRILRASSGMVARIDALTRLNRTVGVGQLMITHSMADFHALPEVDRLRAQGFVERSKMLFLGALPPKEMEYVNSVMALSEKERDLLSSWNMPGSYDPASGRVTPPVGRGKFLLKTSEAPGIAFQVQFVAGEADLMDTNKGWNMHSGSVC